MARTEGKPKTGRFRPASAQSDLLRSPHEESLGLKLASESTAIAVVRLGVDVSLCWAQTPDYFSRVVRKPTFWFPTWSDTNQNQAVHVYKMARGLKFGLRKKGDCTIYVAKTKALISFAVTAKLICVFVFAYIKCWFSHDAAHLFS